MGIQAELGYKRSVLARSPEGFSGPRRPRYYAWTVKPSWAINEACWLAARTASRGLDARANMRGDILRWLVGFSARGLPSVWWGGTPSLHATMYTLRACASQPQKTTKTQLGWHSLKTARAKTLARIGDLVARLSVLRCCQALCVGLKLTLTLAKRHVLKCMWSLRPAWYRILPRR